MLKQSQAKLLFSKCIIYNISIKRPGTCFDLLYYHYAIILRTFENVLLVQFDFLTSSF